MNLFAKGKQCSRDVLSVQRECSFWGQRRASNTACVSVCLARACLLCACVCTHVCMCHVCTSVPVFVCSLFLSLKQQRASQPTACPWHGSESYSKLGPAGVTSWLFASLGTAVRINFEELSACSKNVSKQKQQTENDPNPALHSNYKAAESSSQK